MPSHYHDKETMKTEKFTRKSQPTTHGYHKAQKHKAFIDSPPCCWGCGERKRKALVEDGGKTWLTHYSPTVTSSTTLVSMNRVASPCWQEKRWQGGGRMAVKQQESHKEKENQTTGTTNGTRILVSGSLLLIRRWGRKFEDMHDTFGHGTNV